VADVSETRIARSRPLALMPALTPAARNPRAAVTPPVIAQAVMLRCDGLRRLIDCSIRIVYVLESDDRNDHRNLTAPPKERTLDAVRIDLLGEPTVRHHREPDVDAIAWLVRERANLFISFALRASAQLLDDLGTDTVATLRRVDCQGPFFRDRMTERRQFSAPDDLAPPDGDDKPVGVDCQFAERSR